MQQPRVSVIGTGYLGAVHAAALASQGFTVTAVDTDATKIQGLAAGAPSFYEPGFEELLAEVLPSGRLEFTDDYAAVADCSVHFLCVGTPQQVGSNAADLGAVWSAVEELTPRLAPGSVVAGKSTVPVGTAAAIDDYLAEHGPAGPAAALVWNPEFLREGFAVADTLQPDRIVVGSRDGLGTEQMRAVYHRQIAAGVPWVETDLATAELVKVAANSFLATKISFVNAMAEVCEATGADVTALAAAIGYDDRIGAKFLKAGIGFGGGCLPKDIRAFMARAGELGVGQALTFLREVDEINLGRRARAVEMAEQLAGGDARGQHFAVLGAAFKPESDDIRDSPALDIAAGISTRGGHVVVHDPKALTNARLRYPTLTYADSAAAALTGADVVLLLTEWDEYRRLDPIATAELTAGRAIFDGRNVLDRDSWKAAGWTYVGVGRA